MKLVPVSTADLSDAFDGEVGSPLDLRVARVRLAEHPEHRCPRVALWSALLISDPLARAARPAFVFIESLPHSPARCVIAWRASVNNAPLVLDPAADPIGPRPGLVFIRIAPK